MYVYSMNFGLKYKTKKTIDDSWTSYNSVFRVAIEHERVHILRKLCLWFGFEKDDACTWLNYTFLIAIKKKHTTKVLEELRLGYGINRERTCVIMCIQTLSHGHLQKNNVMVLRELRVGYKLTIDDARVDNNKAMRVAIENGFADVLKELRIGYGLTRDDVVPKNEDGGSSNYELIYLALAKRNENVLEELRIGYELKHDIREHIRRNKSLY